MSNIPVEIVRDSRTPDINPSVALEGVAHINEYAGNVLKVIDYSGVIDLSPLKSDPTAPLLPSDIEWPVDSSKLRLILTQRALTNTESDSILGFGSHMNGTAVVSLNSNAVSSEFVVTHELGHLMGLKYKPELEGSDVDHYHCIEPSCIMRSNTDKVISDELPLYIHEDIDMNAFDTFCEPCQKKLGKQALTILRSRDSLYVRRFR